MPSFVKIALYNRNQRCRQEGAASLTSATYGGAKGDVGDRIADGPGRREGALRADGVAVHVDKVRVGLNGAADQL